MTKTWDAIVVGSGMTGGWAAKELCEAGLETLVLEAGRSITPENDYVEHVPPWEMPYRGLKDRRALLERRPIQRLAGACDEWAAKFFVDDVDNPYSSDTDGEEFRWIRGRQVGGRSILWGRQSYRWSDLDFDANAKDGYGVDWPIRYRDLAPWYEHVERFIGLSGMAENLPQLPDSVFQPAWGLNGMELRVREQLDKAFSGKRRLTQARAAVLTQHHNGRRACHYCGPCRRGCETRSYFSSVNATLPAAVATGKLTLRPYSVVSELVHDPKTDRLAGVRIVDANTMEEEVFRGRVVFLCASAVESARILLNSKSERFATGLANSSDQVGRNLMDHHFQTGASGELPGLLDKTYLGRRPNSCYLPRFVNIDAESQSKDYVRGFGYQCGANRGDRWSDAYRMAGFGAELKHAVRGKRPWRMGFTGFGECLPDPANRVTIDPELVDKWGIPAARIRMRFGENEKAMRKDMQARAAEMLEAIGAKNVGAYERKAFPGFAIHEMGTARMGKDSATSVLNAWNQAWDVENLFVTDGACMTSTACQNPSLTYMALTARAANHAVQLLKRGEL